MLDLNRRNSLPVPFSYNNEYSTCSSLVWHNDHLYVGDNTFEESELLVFATNETRPQLLMEIIVRDLQRNRVAPLDLKIADINGKSTLLMLGVVDDNSGRGRLIRLNLPGE